MCPRREFSQIRPISTKRCLTSKNCVVKRKLLRFKVLKCAIKLYSAVAVWKRFFEVKVLECSIVMFSNKSLPGVRRDCGGRDDGGAGPGSYHLPNLARRSWWGFDFSHPYFVNTTCASPERNGKTQWNIRGCCDSLLLSHWQGIGFVLSKLGSPLKRYSLNNFNNALRNYAYKCNYNLKNNLIYLFKTQIIRKAART